MVESLPVKMRGNNSLLMFLINQMAPKVAEFTMHKTLLTIILYFFFIILRHFTDCNRNKGFPH